MAIRTYDITRKLQDLRNLCWTESTGLSGSTSEYCSARHGTGTSSMNFRLPSVSEEKGVYGHECVNEIVASRLARILEIEHVPYRLLHAQVTINGKKRDTWLNSWVMQRDALETVAPLGLVYRFGKQEGETPLAFCARMGWAEGIHRMAVLDFLIANRNRTIDSISVIRSPKGSLRLAPLGNHGASLLAPGDRFEAIDPANPLCDVPAATFIGSASLEQNLRDFVPASLAIGTLQESDKAALLANLNFCESKAMLENIWNMIWKRWNHYADLRDRGLLQA